MGDCAVVNSRFMAVSTPKTWISLLGHDKLDSPLYFPGGIYIYILYVYV